MSDYTHILLAIDLSTDSPQVCQKARSLAQFYGAKISIIHVVEPLSFTYGSDIPLDFSDIQQDLMNQAKHQLQEIASNIGIDDESCHLTLGRPETEIHNLAAAINADLIVVGSHGRHGLALIFGSTANGVLHGAGCDVLAVRVEESE
ncbi:universal stress protein A [Sinobacterium caligoides]|uniref:Universal stress protein n=1 Tax=Sinobacterium caligoides TaxID=933926 RepID=A0A3N2DKI5_9GAMM|nr:universal stress protein [Sinobacterium caligoides]ROS00314.1 universal stress protein A [Sinobacterium caligoides]